MIDPASGWALTANGLSLTRDGGHSWTTAEPTGVNPGYILSVQFTDPDVGWVVWSSDGLHVFVDRTTDGTGTWTRSQLPSGLRDQFVQSVYTYFAGADGWIVVGTGESLSDEVGSIYVTRDAGRSFAVMGIPAVAQVRFANREDGYAVGGNAARTGVYVTVNGGMVWHFVGLPLPNDAPAAAVEASSVDQTAHGSDLLGATLRDPGAIGVDGFAMYSTANGAERFRLDGDVKFGTNWVGSVATSTPGSADVAAVAVQNSTPPAVITYSSTDQGGHFRRTVATGQSGLSSLAQASEVGLASFVNAQVGWALGVYTVCGSGSTAAGDCHSKQLVFATASGGATWSLLSPP